MPESAEEREKRFSRELEGKNVAHFSVLLENWIQNRMQFDKTLLTLSSGGIGLLITILITVSGRASIDGTQLILYGGAFLGFATCIGTTLTTFRLNSKLLHKELKTQDSATISLKLKQFDKLNIASFIAGIIFFFLIGVFAVIQNFESKEVSNMPNEKETTQLPSGDTLEKSLTGLSTLRPEQPPAPAQPETTQQQDTSSGAASGVGEAAGSGSGSQD